MMIHGYRFNSYLLACLLVLAGGTLVSPAKTRKAEATLRLHLEINRDGTDRCKTAPIFREKPVLVTIDRAPFLSEMNVKEAKVIDVTGGFAIQIQFDRRGSWLLEQYSVSNKGRRFAIFSQFTLPPPPPADKSKPKEPEAKSKSAGTNAPAKTDAKTKEKKSSKDEQAGEGRWLAAPLVSRKISDGMLVFTPDATRAEAEQIVMGLNNAAKKYQSDYIQ